MKQATSALEEVLRAWPQLRGHFRSQQLLPERELLQYCNTHLPIVTPASWPAVRHGLVRSRLLQEVSPGVVTFACSTPEAGDQSLLLPAWRELWQYLQVQLTLPLGCLWSTRWLRAFLPDVPDVLVVEVNWAEQRWATRLLEQSTEWAVVKFGGPLLADGQRMAVLVSPWRPRAPVRRIQGIPVARLEKMLVDASLMPDLASMVSEAHFREAVFALSPGPLLNPAVLLSYAASRGVGSWWSIPAAKPTDR